MGTIFEEYDLAFAVTVRHALLREKLDNEKRNNLIWQPTQEFLKDMAAVTPVQIICFSGATYRLPKETFGWCTNMYVVNSYQAVAYLGTVFCKQAFFDYCIHQANCLKKILTDAENTKELLEVQEEVTRWLQLADNPKIVHDICLCLIPTDREYINELTIIESTHLYLRTCVPELSNVTIYLLSKEKGKLLDRCIWQEAKRTPDPPGNTDAKK